VLNKVSEREQPCQTPLLIFVGRVNVASGFIIFVLLFSYIFVIAVSNGL
jgi:hypothetical protein